jgi:CDP-paratose 2-epimerase
VLDYARSFGLPAIVFRMSCIYGPHQHGTEDQGWVAHFLIQALEDREITIYGDGRQVRDLLFVEDLVDALQLAQTHMPTEAGQAFNIGGGPAHAVSLLEVLEQIGELLDRPARARFDEWRLGDQRYYVSDTAKFARATGWRPTVTVRDGIARLMGWLRESSRLPALAGGAISVRR